MPETTSVEHMSDTMQGIMQKCIQDCRDTHAECELSKTHCLRMGKDHVERGHFLLLEDCSQICSISEDVMLRESVFHKDVCRVCAAICIQCAKSCEQFTDENLKKCADACRRCAESCNLMVNAMEA